MAAWGTDLWDQYDGVCSHLDNRIDQIKRISAFVKERAKLEQDYAKELRKLSKAYFKLKPDELKFPSTDCFSKIIAHSDEIAQLHEGLSSKLQADVYEALKKIATDQTKERKTLMNDASKLQSTYRDALGSNDKMKRKYESAQQDADKALAAYTKADADMTLSRAAVEKIRKTSDLKQIEADEAKASFLKSIDETNKLQNDHYRMKMPEVLRAMQKMDESRTTEMTQHLVRYIHLESEMMPSYTELHQGCKQQFDGVDIEADSRALVDDLQTGLPIPSDMTFDDLINPPSEKERRKRGTIQGQSTGNPKRGSGVPKKHSICEESDTFESLPPAKRKKKLNAKIAELRAAAKKEEAELKALEKLTSVYTANPSLGDPNVVQQKIAPVIQRVDNFNDELYKLECALAQMENREVPTAPRPASAMLARGSVSSATDSHMAAGDDDDDDGDDDEFSNLEGEDNEAKRRETQWGDDFAEPGQQRCKVLYEFTASSGGELSVSVGEVLDMVQDDGSGWISVRRGNDTGYVPLSYVQMQ